MIDRNEMQDGYWHCTYCPGRKPFKSKKTADLERHVIEKHENANQGRDRRGRH